MLKTTELKEFLDEKVARYNNLKFIETDPIQVPHAFTKKEDIEIAAFLTATIAWGNRKSIINNAKEMMQLLDNTPYDFVLNHSNQELKPLSKFVHRTFNSDDFIQFIKSLNHIYKNHGGLENIFLRYKEEVSLQFSIHKLKHHFFEIDHLQRTTKHISDPLRGSAAKRINILIRIINAA